LIVLAESLAISHPLPSQSRPVSPPAADQIFARLDCAKRIWAVGAIHGESAKLQSLHAILAWRLAPGDRLVYLGDYLGIGPDCVGTLDALVDFRARFLCLAGAEPGDIVFLRGAQEEMWRKLLELQFAANPGEVFEWLLHQGAGATLLAYGGDIARGRSACREGAIGMTRWTGALRLAMRECPGHDELLASLRRAAFTAGGELLFVSAGVDPRLPLAAQKDVFWWGPGANAVLSEPYSGFRLVVRGRDHGHGPPVIGRVAASLDGGCGYGGTLTACCFDLQGRPLDWIEA
jgi:serine/threonine protein phosphatase 1